MKTFASTKAGGIISLGVLCELMPIVQVGFYVYLDFIKVLGEVNCGERL
jgi:hypothetical protein